MYGEDWAYLPDVRVLRESVAGMRFEGSFVIEYEGEEVTIPKGAVNWDDTEVERKGDTGLLVLKERVAKHRGLI